MSRFNPPANWPLPKNFTPGPDWRPDPAWGPAPVGWQLWVEEPKKRSWFARHKILTGIAALVLVIGFVNAVSGGDDTEVAEPVLVDAPVGAAQADPAAAQQQAAPAEAPKKEEPKKEEPKKKEDPITPVGSPAKDGDFEFTVTKSSCGKTQVGDEYLNKKAQGQFCEVAITVKNVGKQPEYFSSGMANLIDGSGTQFAVDDEAMIYSQKSNTIFEQINPGNKLTGTLVFDVPADVKPAHIQLKGSLFSSGVNLALN